MRAFIMGLIVFVNFILQTTLFQHIAIGGVLPNTAILIIVSVAILRGDVEGAITGLFSGFLVDLFYSNFIGLNTMLYMLVGYFCAKPFRDFFKENTLFPMTLSFISIIVYEFLYYIFNFLFYGYADIATYFSTIILPEAIYSTVLCIPIFWLMYMIDGRMEDRTRLRKPYYRR